MVSLLFLIKGYIMLKDILEDVLNEKYVNLLNDKEKELYKDRIYDLLQKAYEPIGGLKGSGFKDSDDMVENIKMWKIEIKNDEILAGIMYKDKKFRKGVAVFTNGTKEGKKSLVKMLKDDFSRSIIEVSGPLLKFLENNLPKLVDKYKKTCDEASKLLNKEVKCIDGYKYERTINGNVLTKLMIGTGKKFY